MKQILFSLSIIIVFTTCITKSWSKPKGFTFQYEKKDTGLDQLIDIDGFFAFSFDANRGLVFFADGLVCNISILSNGIIDYRLWGLYIVENDIIKTQFILDGGINGFDINRDFFRIIDRNEIKREAYLSYQDNYVTERQYSLFYTPLPQSVSIETCWLLKKKWFWTKEAWEKRKKQ